MSENINLYDSFEPEARQGRRQADDYMETRPYEDKAGGKHHPVTGELIDIDDESLTTGDVHTDKNYFEANRNQHYEDSMPTAYEDMTMPDLARALAAAEHQADKTKAEDIQDALIDKMSEFSDKNGLDSDAQDNLWNRIMRVKDGEGEKLGGEGKNKESEKPADRKLEIRDEVIAIKRGMAERAKKGLDSPEYDVDFEEEADKKVVELLKEAYDTKDGSDPRVENALRELDSFEERLTNGAVEVDDPELKASKVLRDIAEGRFNGAEWSNQDEENSFLEFLDILKDQFGTDDLDDPRIHSALSRATDKIQAEHNWLVTNEAGRKDEESSLREDLAKIPDLERDNSEAETKVLTPEELAKLPPNVFERLNKEFAERPNAGLKNKVDYAKYIVSQGVTPEQALTALISASEADFERIGRLKMLEIGVTEPTDEQLNVYREKMIESLRGALATETTKVNPETVSTEKQSFRQRAADLARKIDINARALVGRIAEYFDDPEKGTKRKYVAAGAGIIALFAGAKLAQYGLQSNGAEAADVATSRSGAGSTVAERLVKKNPEDFHRMIEWYKAQKKANPSASNAQLANGFNRFLNAVANR